MNGRQANKGPAASEDALRCAAVSVLGEREEVVVIVKVENLGVDGADWRQAARLRNSAAEHQVARAARRAH